MDPAAMCRIGKYLALVLGTVFIVVAMSDLIAGMRGLIVTQVSLPTIITVFAAGWSLIESSLYLARRF